MLHRAAVWGFTIAACHASTSRLVINLAASTGSAAKRELVIQHPKKYNYPHDITMWISGKMVGRIQFNIDGYKDFNQMRIGWLYNHTAMDPSILGGHKATHVGTQLMHVALKSADMWLKQFNEGGIACLKLGAAHGNRNVSVLQAGPVPFYLRFGMSIDQDSDDEPLPPDLHELKNAGHNMILGREAITNIIRQSSMRDGVFGGIHPGSIVEHGLPEAVANCKHCKDKSPEKPGEVDITLRGCEHCLVACEVPERNALWEGKYDGRDVQDLASYTFA